MKFKVETLAERVVIKPFIEMETKGGILLARDERSQAINTDRGEIFLVGPQAWYDLPEKPQFKAGDKVIYSKYGAKTIKDESTNPASFYILCNDKDVLIGYED